MDHAARDQVLHLGRVRGHVRRARVRLQRLGVAPLFDEDECIGAEFGLKTPKSFGVDGEAVLDAAILGANGGNVGSGHSQYGFTLTRLGGDDGYDVRRDFAHVVLLASVPGILAVHPSVPARTTREFIDHAKARPGQLNYASTGSGGPQHLGMELFKTLAGVDIAHIPYKGAAPALTDLLSGQVHSMFGNMISTLPHTRSGRLRALAVSSATRSQAAPELPTVAESGVRGFESGSWWGIAVPVQTSRPIIEKISTEVNRILALPELRNRMAAEGAELLGGTPEAATAYVRAEIEKWAKVVKFAKMRVE